MFCQACKYFLRFTAEPQHVHPHWWKGSAVTLGLPETAFPDAVFGVTPAVLSTIGALITTTLIRDRFEAVDWQQVWISFLHSRVLLKQVIRRHIYTSTQVLGLVVMVERVHALPACA